MASRDSGARHVVAPVGGPALPSAVAGGQSKAQQKSRGIARETKNVAKNQHGIVQFFFPHFPHKVALFIGLNSPHYAVRK